MNLDQYQIDGIDEVADFFGMGMEKILCQLATGGGKTVMFSALSQRYINKISKNILIVVHREELLNQARKTLYDWQNIIAEPVTASTKTLNPSRVYVGMVETVNNRLAKNPHYFHNIGLIIVDECHRKNFQKLLDYFPGAWIVGFTATAKNSSKKHPLKKIYQEIVTCIDIPELIELNQRNPARGLVPCVTYQAKNINRSELHTVAGDFDKAELSKLYSKAKHVENAVQGYEEHCKGKKTIVFNCSVEHSLLVHETFIRKGYNSRHLDSDNCTKEERAEALTWFKHNPDAILNNVGLFVEGFDEPTVEAVLFNRATKSIIVWLQCCGRGSRPCPAIGKKYFTVVDMGDNATNLGEWSDPRDWNFIFHNPEKPMPKTGVGAIKVCVHCEAIIAAQAIKCKYCDGMQPIPEPSYDEKLVEFRLITKNVDVKKLIEENKAMRKINGEPVGEYATLHRIKRDLVEQSKKEIQTRKIDDKTAYALLEIYQDKVRDWCNVLHKPYNSWHKQITAEWMFTELKEVYKWEPTKMEA